MTEYKELVSDLLGGPNADALFIRRIRNEAAAAINAQSARIEALEAERDEARLLVTEANNSLYGSQGYFHSLDGGPFNRYHLAGGIEKLKQTSNKHWHELQDAEARCKRLEEALRPFATGSVDVSGTAVILDSLSARDARDAARLALQENTNGG